MTAAMHWQARLHAVALFRLPGTRDRNMTTIRSLTWMLLSLLLFAGVALGQNAGIVKGTVEDNTGGIVAGAEVKLRNQATGQEAFSTSDEEGGFQFERLPFGDYVLTVVIISVDQPSMGFSFTVKMEAGWTLKRAAGGAPVWQESIRSQHTAGATDASAGVERLRLATEGAARNNIAQGLSSISKLNL